MMVSVECVYLLLFQAINLLLYLLLLLYCAMVFFSFVSFSSSALRVFFFFLLKSMRVCIERHQIDTCVSIFMSDVTDLRNDEEVREKKKTHIHFTTQWQYPIHRDDRFIFHHLDQWFTPLSCCVGHFHSSCCLFFFFFAP